MLKVLLEEHPRFPWALSYIPGAAGCRGPCWARLHDTGTVSHVTRAQDTLLPTPCHSSHEGANSDPWWPLLHRYAEEETRWWQNEVQQYRQKKIFFKEDPLSLYFQVYSQKSGYWSTASQTWNSGCQVAKTPLQIYSSQNFLNFLQL